MITFLAINAVLFAIALILLLAKRFLITYGECLLTVNAQKYFKVPGGENLLTDLNLNKIFIPSACGGKATCGFCKVKVLKGGGSILPTEEVFMTWREKAERVRLACQVKVKEDLEVAVPEFLLEAQEFESEVVDIKDLTPDIKLLSLELLNNTIDFKPGQYIEFKIPGTDESRGYSIASTPSIKDQIELIIRLVPGGLCSTYVHRALEKGDKVNFTGPFGEFYLREESQKDIIAIAGGCGMAPIRSIIYYLVERGMPRRFFYFFGVRGKKDLFFDEELRELEQKFPNFKYIPALSEPGPKDLWEGEVGLITAVAERRIEERGEREAYLCGPEPMIEAANRVLTKKGISFKNIYYERF